MRVSAYEMAVKLRSNNMSMEYRGVISVTTDEVSGSIGLELSFSSNCLLQMRSVVLKQVLRSLLLSYQKKAGLAPAQSSLLFGMVLPKDLYSVAFRNHILVHVTPKKGLAGLVPAKPSFCTCQLSRLLIRQQKKSQDLF